MKASLFKLTQLSPLAAKRHYKQLLGIMLVTEAITNTAIFGNRV